MQTTQTIVEHSPASFRPVAPTLRSFLRGLTICLPSLSSDSASGSVLLTVPLEIRQMAAGLIAALPLTAGKAQSSPAWGTAIREALGGIGEAMNGIARDGWEEGQLAYLRLRSQLTRQSRSRSRPLLCRLDCLHCLRTLLLDLARAWIGWRVSPRKQSLYYSASTSTKRYSLTYRYPTSRAVPVPIAHVVSAGLRCLNLTLDTPVS